MEHYDAEVEGPRPARRGRAQHPSEMLRRGVPNVYLDLRSLHPGRAHPRGFPEMYRSCLEYGIDITRDLLPVVPAAHYSCGGVWVDEWGADHVERLYAIGEVVLHRTARRQPAGEHVAARRIGVGPSRRRGTSSSSLAPGNGARFDDIPPWQDTGDGSARPGADRAGHELDQAHHVELRRPGAHHRRLRARSRHCATSKSRSSASIARRR